MPVRQEFYSRRGLKGAETMDNIDHLDRHALCEGHTVVSHCVDWDGSRYRLLLVRMRYR